MKTGDEYRSKHTLETSAQDGPQAITCSRKGRSPPALLFFQFSLGRAWFTVTKKTHAGSCSLPGSWKSSAMHGDPGDLPWCYLLKATSRLPWSFDTELEAQIAVTQVHTGTRGVKAKPLGVSPKTTHRPVVLREQGSNLHASRDVFIPG